MLTAETALREAMKVARGVPVNTNAVAAALIRAQIEALTDWATSYGHDLARPCRGQCDKCDIEAEITRLEGEQVAALDAARKGGEVWEDYQTSSIPMR